MSASSWRRYRKKPVVVEAQQWFPGVVIPGVTEIPFGTLEDSRPSGLVVTLEGTMKVRPGAYVIRGVRGELYPCDDAIFAETYEEVV